VTPNDVDTIAAISTPIGEGGIGIVRLSGDQVEDIIQRVFRRPGGNGKLESHRLYYGEIVDPASDDVVDEVLVSLMRSPRSYTREDVAEINCHGGVVALRRVLELVVREGARIAERGEFTKRAFLNGRIDLSQAESVIDIIRARTEDSLSVAVRQLQGELSERVREIEEEMVGLLAALEAALDFPEDDIAETPRGEVRKRVMKAVSELDGLLTTSETGRVVREGVSTVIVGSPNVGKSTLLNALLRENRAIVTEVPGTTRDVIEEIMNLNGIPLRLIDTAGIRVTQDVVEKMGVERGREALAQADLVLWVVDASQGMSEVEMELAGVLKTRKVIVCINKIDLERRIGVDDVRKVLPGKPVVEMSLKEGTGRERLEQAIEETVLKGGVRAGEALVTRSRQREALERAREAFVRVIDTIDKGMNIDFMTIDLRDGLEHLGEVTGETVSEAVIDRIFKDFCIGK